MEKEKPNYYAVIPAEVRYNSKITANAKLLYGEITALCAAEGYCWANNSYFSNLYSVSHKTISNWLKSLKECGVITIQYSSINGGKDLTKRKIYIVPMPGNNLPTAGKKLHTPQKINSTGVGKNSNAGDEKKFTYNNTLNKTINNTNNDSMKKRSDEYSSSRVKSKNEPSLEEFADFCLSKGMHFDYEQFFYVNTTQYKWQKNWKDTISMWCNNPHSMPEYYIAQELYKFIYYRDKGNDWLKKHSIYSYIIKQ